MTGSLSIPPRTDGSDAGSPTGGSPVPVPDRWTVALAVAGAVGVVAYVTSWIIAGRWIDGYSPVRDAISESFAIGVPAGPRTLMTASLIATGLLLAAFGWALARGLPGEGLAAPIGAVIAGVGTIGAAVFPCTFGCPGFGASVTDSAHSVMAGAGYLALILTPLLAARRVRTFAPTFATASVVLGGIALLGFVLRYVLGVGDEFGGLQQRILNTTADAWYVLAAVWLVRWQRRGVPER